MSKFGEHVLREHAHAWAYVDIPGIVSQDQATLRFATLPYCDLPAIKFTEDSERCSDPGCLGLGLQLNALIPGPRE